MLITIQVELSKQNGGPSQDRWAVVQALTEEIEGLGEFFTQDERHENETGYEIVSASEVEPS